MYYSQLSSSVRMVNKDARHLNENRTGTFYDRGECLTANVGGIKKQGKVKGAKSSVRTSPDGRIIIDVLFCRDSVCEVIRVNRIRITITINVPGQ